MYLALYKNVYKATFFRMSLGVISEPVSVLHEPCYICVKTFTVQ